MVKGTDGDDNMYLHDDQVGHGGAGDDYRGARDQSVAIGSAGSDFLNIWGNASVHGGDGDDILDLHPFGGFGGSATGGAGDDVFRISGDFGTAGATEPPGITDYQRGGDRFAIAAVFPPESVSITSDGTDSTVEVMHETLGTSEFITQFVVRGVVDLTEEVLWFAYSGYDDLDTGDLMHWQGGTAGDDVIGLPDTPTALFAGDDDDNVTGGVAGVGGAEFVDLGAGDDTYSGVESFSWVKGGAGDDDITVHLVPGLDYPRPSPEAKATAGILGNNIPMVDGGAGDDAIHISETPAGTLSFWAGLHATGGARDDLNRSDATGVVLTGGSGADTLIGLGDTSYDLRDGNGDLARISVGAGEAVSVRLDALPAGWDGGTSAIDQVKLSIDPRLTEPVTTEFSPSFVAELGRVAPAQTRVFVGGVNVAMLMYGTETQIDVASGPRIATLRL